MLFKYAMTAFILIFSQNSANAFQSAVSVGSAGSGKAAAESFDSPLSNPAVLAFIRGYQISATVIDQTASQMLGDNQQMGISFTDNLPDTVIPTSLLAWKEQSNVPGAADNEQKNIKLSVGNFVGKTWAMGFGLLYRDDFWAQKKTEQVGLTTGFLLNPIENLGLAMVFENMATNQINVRSQAKLAAHTGLGLNYNYRRFVRYKLDLDSDQGNTWNKPTISAGLDSYWNHWLMIRIGYQKNNELASDTYAAGFGFVGPKFSIQYGYQNSPSLTKLTRHAVDLTIPVW